MEKIQVKPVFVKTKNVRNFESMMDALAQASGEGRLGAVPSPPGRGKTRTAQWYAANNGCVYLRVASIWKRNELDFIQALCREVGISTPPGRKGACYQGVVQALYGTDRPVFIDEMQKLRRDFLDIVLDLSDATACPFILIGEEELQGMMQANGRVWSRTYQRITFDPITVSDIIFYAMDSAQLKLPPGVADILHKSSQGDFRLVRRDLIALVQFINAKGANSNGEPVVTEEMARIATGMGLKGARANGGRS
jgi:DNA transposition AAA+ family ATPase